MLYPVTTGAGGNYCFNNLLPGTYKVYEEPQAGWTQTFPLIPKYAITLQAGQTLQNIDFGNDSCESATTTQRTCMAGIVDAFDCCNAPEPTAPSAALQNALSSCTLYPHFDTTGGIPSTPCDECLAHTFSNCWPESCLVVGASLSGSLYRGGCNPGDPDYIEIWQTSGPGAPKIVWSQSIAVLNGGNWNPGDLFSFLLLLDNLPPDANGTTNVLAALQDGNLDVVIRGNTAVDYLRLDLELCCCCPKGDMNGDGLLTPADAVLAINCIFLNTPPCPCNVDMNGDGIYTASDAVLVINCAFLGICPPCP
jgi:hypothetical protein